MSAQTTESAGTVRIEAESPTANISRTIVDPVDGAIDYVWTATTAIGGYSGTGLMQVLPNDAMTVTTNWTTASPELQYSINFTNPGTYYLWVRGYAESSESLSVYVGIDGASPTAARIDLPKTGAWSWSNAPAGSAVPVAVTVAAAGTHTLSIWMCEAGFALDKIILTLNARYSPEYSADFWRNQSVYQIITDRFFNGDTSNDVSGLPNYSPTTGNQAHGGDFKGIEKKLDYIKALGATAIWISPVVKNANGDYHGYAATDFYAVNPRMGTLADLQRLVAEAHKRGILVINDVVVNHGSTWVDSGDSGWSAFKYPPSGYNLRYNSGGQQYAAPFANTNLTAAFGNTSLSNIFHNNGGTQDWGNATQVELGELASLDDFRTESSYVREKMREIWSYWINAAGFDAYRIDTVKHVEMGFWDEWTPAVRAAAAAADKPNFFMFGEVFDGADSKCGSYTGTKSSGAYKMESVLDYPLYYKIGSVFATASGNTGQIEDRYNSLTTANYDASATNSLVLNLDNHDNPRFLSTDIGGNTGRLELALVFLYTSRGIPSLYYGTEQDFDGGKDPWCREDMFDGQFEGGPSNGDNFNMTGARFKLVAKLNNLRRLYPALRTGSHDNLWANYSGPGLLVYARRLGNEEAYVVLNTATSPQTISTRPTIHPAGTVLVDVLNPSNTLTVTTGTDGIPSFSLPGTSCRIYVAQSQVRALSPAVDAVSPAHDASGISVASTISMTFDRGMNPTTTQAAFSTVPATTGTFTWSAGNTVMTYTPSSNMAGTTLYGVRIESTATDATGLAMFAPFESRFTTGAASTLAKPSVNSVSSSGITASGATLGATVTPNGAATTVRFEYGATTSYGTSTAGQSIGSGSSSVATSAAIGGLSAGTVHHFRVVATNSQGTTYGPDGTFTTDALLPQVTTTAASYVTTGTASLNGDVNPNGLPTTVWFEYGVKSDVLTLTTPVEDVGSAAGIAGKWASIADLAPDTTYYFRIVAQTGTSVVHGSVLSFATQPVKPTLGAVAALNIATTGATLSAAVSPNGTDSTAWFEYGTDPNYGLTTTVQNVSGAGVSPLTITADLAGLVFGQTYHFRAIAQNSYGVTYGADQAFTTSYPPPEAVTGAATVSGSTASVAGLVDPNGSEAVYWFEYGTTEALGSSTLSKAGDDIESYSTLAYSSTSAGATVSANGGTGFGKFTSYARTSSSRGGIRLVTSNSSNGTAGRQVDGAKSFGVYAGTSTSNGTHSGYRALAAPRQSGQVKFSVRFDISNLKGFTGVNLKSANGTTFSANEMLSVGMVPPANAANVAHTAFTVADAAGQRTIDFGTEIRGAVLDVSIGFDARAGTYTCDVKRREDASYRSISGTLKRSGADVRLAALGYMNGNNTGNNSQHLILDVVEVVSAASAGNGAEAVAVSGTLSGLAADMRYSYRTVASSTVGTTYGATSSFVTGTDLSASKTSVGPFAQGQPGLFSVAISNAGGAASTGTVTVTEQPPDGMSVTSMSGNGWTFDPGNLTCTRPDALAPGATYPAILVEVDVARNATQQLTNRVSVSGGGDMFASNNSSDAAADIALVPTPIESWRKMHFGTAANAGVAADSYVATEDGLPNLLKYALGLDPTTAAALSERPSLETFPPLAIKFRRARAATDVTIHVEAADSVTGGWTSIWDSATNAYGGGTNDFETVTVRDSVPMDQAVQRYLRLRVSQP